MAPRLFALCACLAVVLGALVAVADSELKNEVHKEPFSNDFLTHFALNRYNLLRKVTDGANPSRVQNQAVLTLCRPAQQGEFPIELPPSKTIPSPHRENEQEAWIHVFISPTAEEKLRAGSTDYAAGTVILKQKFSDASGTQSELFTGMLKHPAGYDADCGDWEFFTLSGNGQTVTSRGRIASCRECHLAYKETGFVARDYLDSPKTIRPATNN